MNRSSPGLRLPSPLLRKERRWKGEEWSGSGEQIVSPDGLWNLSPQEREIRPPPAGRARGSNVPAAAGATKPARRSRSCYSTTPGTRSPLPTHEPPRGHVDFQRLAEGRFRGTNREPWRLMESLPEGEGRGEGERGSFNARKPPRRPFNYQEKSVGYAGRTSCPSRSSPRRHGSRGADRGTAPLAWPRF